MGTSVASLPGDPLVTPKAKRVDKTGLMYEGRVRGTGQRRYTSPDGLIWKLGPHGRHLFIAWRLLLLKVCPDLRVLPGDRARNGRDVTAVYVPLVGPRRAALNEETGRHLAWQITLKRDWRATVETALRMGLPTPKLKKRALKEAHNVWVTQLQLATNNWTVWPKTGVRLNRAPRKAREPVEIRRARRRVVALTNRIERLNAKLATVQAILSDYQLKQQPPQ